MGRKLFTIWGRVLVLELGICSRPVCVSAYCGISSKRPPWKWWIFGGFLQWFWSQNPPKDLPKKTVAESASRKQKIRRHTTPPPRNPPARPQTSAALPTNPPVSKCTPGLLRLRRFALGGVFRAWILGHSLAAFWAWSRLPCWNAPAIPQLLLVGGTRFAVHPSRQHF